MRKGAAARLAAVCRPRSAGPLLAGMALGALGGCLDLGSLRDIAFPPTVPGLPPDRPWQPLPVGVLMSESDVEAVAMAVCSPPGCGPEAVVGVFRARGSSGEQLVAEVADPARLVRSLAERRAPRGGRTPAARAVMDSEPLRIGAFDGLVLRMTRPGRIQAAYGIALTARRGGAATIVIVVSPSEDEARRIARDVASGLG